MRIMHVAVNQRGYVGVSSSEDFHVCVNLLSTAVLHLHAIASLHVALCYMVLILSRHTVHNLTPNPNPNQTQEMAA